VLTLIQQLCSMKHKKHKYMQPYNHAAAEAIFY